MGAGGPEDWLRTPGLVRVARALAERGRFADSATTLSGIVSRRIGDAVGAETDDLLAAFLAAVDQRLAAEPQNVGLLELRATLAAQQSDGTPEAIADPRLRLAVAYRTDGNQHAIDELLERRPEAASAIGDLFASDNEWQRAVDIYSKGISWGDRARPSESNDGERWPSQGLRAELLAKRAAAYERLQEWDAAAADWAQTAQASPQAAELLAEFARRLAQNGQSTLAASHFERAQQHYEDELAGKLARRGRQETARRSAGAARLGQVPRRPRNAIARSGFPG
ncbi:MAG: hypothetical protein ACREHD_13795 [Pirellulales bacterium]